MNTAEQIDRNERIAAGLPVTPRIEPARSGAETVPAPARGSASWRERPSCGGWWWSHDAKSWNLAFYDGLGIVLVAAPNNVKGWDYAADASGWWWGPWTPPAMTPNDPSSATRGENL